jgi:hypothetical protein
MPAECPAKVEGSGSGHACRRLALGFALDKIKTKTNKIKMKT